MKRYKAAIFGTGFVGQAHMEALRREHYLQVAAVADRDAPSAERLGDFFSVPRREISKLLDDPEIDAVHICTPNAMHFPMVRDALNAGKHVICEKPLTTTIEEAEELVALAAKTGLRNCVCHNLRFYPMVQQMRRMREDGDLGEIMIVQGTYSQDWLFHDTDWNWRVESKFGGASRCMADIGSHWFDTVEHITGQRVTSLCADLQTFHKTRKQPKKVVETFANKMLSPEDYIETPVDTEDFGAVLFRMGDRTRGCMTASQVSGGRKNRFFLEIFGTKGSVAWDGENPNQLWIGDRDGANRILLKDPSLLKPSVRSFADLPGGHAEGYGDTFKQIFRLFYTSLQQPEAPIDYPQFVDGLRQMILVRAELESSRRHAWVDVPPVKGL